MATFYIDTDNFSTATAVWEDSSLTIKAPDGFYSFSGIYRQQFDGFLLNVISCTPPPPPTIPCDEFSVETDASAVTLTYTDCTGEPVSVELEPSSSLVFCAQRGTVSAPGALVNIIGNC